MNNSSGHGYMCRYKLEVTWTVDSVSDYYCSALIGHKYMSHSQTHIGIMFARTCTNMYIHMCNHHTSRYMYIHVYMACVRDT